MHRITRERPRQITVTVTQDNDEMVITYGVIRETFSRANAVQELLPDWNPTVAIADSIRRFFGADNVSGLRVTHEEKLAVNTDTYRVTCLVTSDEFLAG